MKTMLQHCCCILVALCSCAYPASGQVRISAVSSAIKAKDGHELTAYELYSGRKFKLKKNPRAVFFYIQGSEYESVTEKIHFLASAVILGGRAMMLEKRGCYHDHIDTATCYRYADKTTRVNDHLTTVEYYLKSVPESVPVVLVGGSEGGDVAAAVARLCPRINYLILIGSGGGWSQKTEFQYMVRQHPGYLGFDSVAALNQKLAEIASSPDGDEMWAGHPYRRWQSFLNDSSLMHLRQVDIPILLLQGEADTNVPCQSARALQQAFSDLNKTNLTYVEYPDVDHRLMHVRDGKSRYPYLEVDIIQWLHRYGLVSNLEKSIFVRRVKRAHKDIWP